MSKQTRLPEGSQAQSGGARASGTEWMNIPSGKYAVGYGRPPEHSKWKKGQCGNPARIRKCCTAKPVVAMIDEFFASEHVFVENGIRKRRSALEIILLQLHNKAICGSTRAFNVLTKYHEFAATSVGPNPFRALLVDDAGNPIKPRAKNG
jgi:hypothetical protein